MKKLILIIFCLFIFNGPAVALVEVDITRGNLNPLPIAISPLYVEPGSKDIKQSNKIIKNIGEEISKVIEVNFKRSGLFNPLKKESFVQNPDIAHVKPRFEDWRLIKAQALVTGKANVSENKLRVLLKNSNNIKYVKKYNLYNKEPFNNILSKREIELANVETLVAPKWQLM